MLNLINGYVCKNCDDVELAKRGVDPTVIPRPRPASTATPATKEEPAEEHAEQPAEQRVGIEPGVGIKLDVTG